VMRYLFHSTGDWKKSHIGHNCAWAGKLELTDLEPPKMAVKIVLVTVKASATRSSFRRKVRQGERLLVLRDRGVDSLGISSGLPMLSGSSRRGRNPRSRCCSGNVL
jgi:hypothetical protein